MKVELHLHTCRYSGCAVATPVELMEKLIATGYEAVYITEHHNVWYGDELDQLQQRFPDIRVFPGVEVTLESPAFLHLLVLGTNDPGYLTLPTASGVLKKARAEGFLTILSHPFRWGGAEELLSAGLLPDALEYQTPNVSGAQAERALAAARDLGLAAVNSGDVHSLDFVDRFWIETNRVIQNAADIREIVLAGDYENRGVRQ